jgi:hypothetical protein
MLDRIYFDPQGGKRDFGALDPARLGALYEGLSEYEFQEASAEPAAAGKDRRSGRESGRRPPVRPQSGPAGSGELVLFAWPGRRKTSGTYYTPESLARPLARRAVRLEVSHLGPEKSLWDTRLIDLACGSGSLLKEGLSQLAWAAFEVLDQDERLTRAWEKEKARSLAEMSRRGLDPGAVRNLEFRLLQRMLLERCLYGVDLSRPAAVLCRAALSLAVYVPGLGRPDLAGHIKCGSSLAGLGPESPPDSGRAARIRLEIAALVDQSERADPGEEAGRRSAVREPLEALVREGRKVYSSFRPAASGQGRQEADSFPEGPDRLQAEAGSVPEGPDALFHWELEFPEVFLGKGAPGGFEIIIGNPPWEKTKFEEPQFFAGYEPDYRLLSNEAKSELAARLLSEPAVAARYRQSRFLAEMSGSRLRQHYPWNRRSGDGNLFRYFAERGLKLLAPGGSLNYIVPTGLLTEDNSAELRREIFRSFRLRRIDSFENRAGLFPDIDRRYKFALIQIENTPDPQQKARCRFMLTDPRVLESEAGAMDYSLADVRTFSPRHLAYFETAGGQRDLAVLKHLHRQFPPLSPRWLNFYNELHATSDKGIFAEKPDRHLIPLCKGEMIRPYQALARPPQYWVDPEVLDRHVRSREISRLKKDLSRSLAGGPEAAGFPAAFSGPEGEAGLIRHIRPGRYFLRLALRAIARDTNERTLVAAVLPRMTAAQNSLWLSVPGSFRLDPAAGKIEFEEVPLARLLFAQALFNSLPADWLLRASVAMNVNKTYLMRLPLPQPADEELASDPFLRRIIGDSARLSLFRSPFLEPDLAGPAAGSAAGPVKSEEDFDCLLARLDLAFGRLFRLEAADLLHFLKSFRVLRVQKPHYAAVLTDLIRNSA